MNTDNQQESLEFDIGWLVGVWESEGWLSLRSCYLKGERLQRYRPEIGVTNTDPKVLDNVERILKNLGLAYWRQGWQKVAGQRSRSMVRLEGLLRCQRFLKMLGPRFQSKKDRVKIVEDFIAYRQSMSKKTPYGEKEHTWYTTLRQLNAPLSSQIQNPQRLYAEPVITG